MSDIISIHELKTETIIGILAWERKVKQSLIFDISYRISAKTAAADDNINNTVDYAALSEYVLDFVENSSYGLLETLTEHLANKLRENFSLPWLKITVSKPGAINKAKGVSLTIERE